LLYVLLNAAFALLVGFSTVAIGFANPRFLYLVLLFALCSSGVIDLDGLNGRYALLALFMFVYFVSFGGIDLRNVLTGGDAGSPVAFQATSVLSKAEMLILAGGIMLILGYRTAVLIGNARSPSGNPRDWPRSMIILVGLIFWGIGTIATYRWNVYIVTDVTNEATRKGLASIGELTTTAYILGQLLQPLGMLLLAYAWTLHRNRYFTAFMIVIVVLQIFIGFVIDVKSLAMLGIILVIMTSVLVNGRLPKTWLAAGVIFVAFIYPYFTAYRTAIHGAGISRATVVENFGQALKKTLAAKDEVNTGPDRAQTFLERSNVKGSVEVIVAKAGNGVAFQRGHTLSPLLATFVPKIVWADKERIPTGQLFNKQFHIDDSDDIYISPSHLGELYWNFGWAGALAGMTVIGALCGWVGVRFNLAEYRTVTRVLVTVITIRQLIVVFESSVADCYVVWLRSLAGIGVLHVIFARISAVSRLRTAASAEPVAAARPHGAAAFPNLLT